jgi:hypothetical protein
VRPDRAVGASFWRDVLYCDRERGSTDLARVLPLLARMSCGLVMPGVHAGSASAWAPTPRARQVAVREAGLGVVVVLLFEQVAAKASAAEAAISRASR